MSREREAAASTQNFLKNGLGYLTEQSTKPQTIGFSLADSPVGLLAWIYEKLVICSDAYPWTDDEGGPTPTIYLSQPNCIGFAVLTWVSIYWFSQAGPAASVRIYYELTASGDMLTFPKTTVPVGLSFFPKEPVQLPKVCVTTLSSGYIRLIAVGGQFDTVQSKDRFRVGPQGWGTLCGLRAARSTRG